jgi:lipoprotein NlpD
MTNSVFAMIKRVFLVTLILVSVACSAPTPAPIKDQSSNIPKAKPVVIPNWSVTNEAKSTPSTATNKAKVNPNTTTTTNNTNTQTKSATENSTSKTETRDPIIPDPGFRIGKPSSAPVGEGFNGSSNKGIDYVGKMGDPVLAAGEGKVIFSGNSLRSYGNLVIVKHNNNYISIYAHNSKNLVKEGDAVKRGQKIAEMGNTESDRVKLHFELRRDSRPVDPTGYFDS